MTITRIPVEGSSLPPPLECRGQCPQFLAGSASVAAGEHFHCDPHREGPCTGTANERYISFLYPRKRRESGTIHTHEGIDIHGEDGVSQIVAVAGGTVRVASNEYSRGFGGYGRVVVIEAPPHPSDGVVYWYLYGHCNHVQVAVGDVVHEHDVLATVGTTLYDTPGVVGHTPPHLHFEVASSPYPKNPEFERTGWSAVPTDADHVRGWREDPFVHLEMLGPWGPHRVYFPLTAEGGGEPDDHVVDAATCDALYRATEQDQTSGGYFPLGANNFWHGGLHLHAPEGTLFRAPFGGTIVAARLDPDETRAMQEFGSVNFILLRHELPAAIADELANDGRPAAEAAPPRRDSVGRYLGAPPRRATAPTNPPARVREVRSALSELGFHHPATPPADDGALDDALVDAIAAFQTDMGRTPPDGVISIPGPTWRELQRRLAVSRAAHPSTTARTATASDGPPPKVVYSLFMHAKPEALTNALAARIPWLAHVQCEPPAGSPPPDEPDLYAMTGLVGPGQANALADVRWVQSRLTYHQSYSGPVDGLFTDAVRDAIMAFQRAHVAYYRRRAPDGIITPHQGTQDTLAATRETVGRGSTTRRGAAIDPDFAAKLEEVDPATQVAKVVTGFEARISAGDVLWTVGSGRAFSDTSAVGAGAGASHAQSFIHWEIFSAEKLMGTWEAIESDVDDDLTMDVPGLVDWVESDDAGSDPGGSTEPLESSPSDGADGTHILTPAEVQAFYAGTRSRHLRETQVKFCSEWAVDGSHAVQSLQDLGFHTAGLQDALAPYLWWNDAGETVPSERVVWHYNPISFMHCYAEALPAPAPAATTTPPAEVEDRCSTDPSAICAP
jgi:peptidoglycan hydrolase-like protein with peptidoglycan-binding domain